MTIAETLRAAADHLERVGWRNDGYGGERDRPCCVVQATGWVACGAETIGADEAADKYLYTFLGLDDTESLTHWNDSQPSVAPVLAALRAAADDAERQGL